MAYIYDLTDTWNASGTTFNGIKLNVTNTASAAASKLVTLQIGGTEHFSVTKAGVGYFSGNVGIGTTAVELGGTFKNVILEGGSGGIFQAQTTSGAQKMALYADSSNGYVGTRTNNPVVIVQNNTERMRIDSSGNLLVGGSTALGKIYLEGDVNGNIDTWIRNNNSGSSARAGIVLNAFGNSWRMGVGSSANNGNALTWNVDIGGANTERMRIDSSGNVGIGTSSPSSRLTITGGTTEIRDGNYLMLRPVGNGWDMRLQATGTQLDVLSGGAPGSPIMSLVNGGNVGIGTSSPTTRLQIGDIGATDATFQGRIKLEDTSTSLQTVGGLEYVTSSFGAGYGWKINSIDSSGVHLVFGTRQNSATWTETMRLNTSGFLLVGTTAPLGGNTSSEFKVTGAGSWPLTLNANDRGLLVRNSAASSGIYAYFEYNGGTNNGSISWSGGTTAYNTTSDARIKDNIVDAPDAGNLIDAIQVRSWDFKADGAHWRYGMVAQELLEVAPEAVNKPEDEEMMMGVDYSKLVPMLIKEVQSLRARVAQLEGN